MKKTTTALLLAILGSAALAHGGVKDKNVMARMVVMKNIGDQMKIIGTMAKGAAAFDADTANAALSEIAVQSAQITPLFKTPATDPKSEALPLVWQDWDSFARRARDARAVAERLAGSVQTKADLGPVMGQLGQTCKSCHSRFKQ